MKGRITIEILEYCLRRFHYVMHSFPQNLLMTGSGTAYLKPERQKYTPEKVIPNSANVYHS